MIVNLRSEMVRMELGLGLEEKADKDFGYLRARLSWYMLRRSSWTEMSRMNNVEPYSRLTTDRFVSQDPQPTTHNHDHDQRPICTVDRELWKETNDDLLE